MDTRNQLINTNTLIKVHSFAYQYTKLLVCSCVLSSWCSDFAVKYDLESSPGHVYKDLFSCILVNLTKMFWLVILCKMKLVYLFLFRDTEKNWPQYYKNFFRA